ncbi:MAG: hypothetical protein ED557_11070 [Balneola sp.]|nr:MAG: hypothetical protein ED557_11070 [Balneola sp.]
MFGLPWFAIIPIVAIIGGLFYAYKEKELSLEEKRLTSAKESHELRKMIFNLKTRIENLEAIASENSSKSGEISLDEIEIKDDLNASDSTQRSKVRG